MIIANTFARYLCLCVDIQAYGQVSARDQLDLQIALAENLESAARCATLDRRTWTLQTRGDGELALIPATEPEARVVGNFVRELATLLFRYNCDRQMENRLRLRLAFDHGPVQKAAVGFAGYPVVAVSRLVDSTQCRLALAAATDASVAVMLSQRIYNDLVRGGHTMQRASAYRPVRVRVKEFSEIAYLRVVGTDVHNLQIESDTHRRRHPARSRPMLTHGGS